MGDGTSYSQPLFTHTYATNGPYQICLTVADGAGCIDTYCDTLQVDTNGIIIPGQSGNNGISVTIIPDAVNTISEHAKEFVRAYPNPTNGLISITGIHPGESYQLYDAGGQSIQQGVLGSARTVDMSRVPQGVYILQSISNERTVQIRLVKE